MIANYVQVDLQISIVFIFNFIYIKGQSNYEMQTLINYFIRILDTMMIFFV